MRKVNDMDMNWQAMLHEAANASFEENLDVYAAADKDICSRVDLPKAKIRELSEKILRLPQQGIVLLFSRYCFSLSPEETEKFYQIKNAKGHFCFYHELLSSSMGLNSEQIISDDSLNHACKIAMKDYLHTELKEDSAAYGTEKRRTYIAFRRIRKTTVVAAIIITLLFSTAMANAQFREKVISWAVKTFEKYSSFELQSDRENTQADLQNYKPTYLPDGAELLNTVEQSEMIVYEFAISNSGRFEILLSHSDAKVYLNTENAEITSFEQNEISGYYFKQGDWNYVCCDRDGYFLAIYGSINKDELIRIAAGITKK
jgi:hypothetical protein